MEENYKAKAYEIFYTRFDFTNNNYKGDEVLSINHSMPWSFVLHGQM
ncbi:hypothetical protein [Clostridium beijerinckii]|nr:hypothetical protein [Clostridium beijerinckii]